jgi:hypothetical protein
MWHPNYKSFYGKYSETKTRIYNENFQSNSSSSFSNKSMHKGTLIDCIILDNIKYNKISVHPRENCLSDHVARILVLENLKAPLKKYTHTRKIRTFDDKSIANFQSYFREEVWDSVYNSDHVNRMFNNFHCILLRYFEKSFPMRYNSYRTKYNGWITTGIIKSHVIRKGIFTLYTNIQINLKLRNTITNTAPSFIHSFIHFIAFNSIAYRRQSIGYRICQ